MDKGIPQHYLMMKHQHPAQAQQVLIVVSASIKHWLISKSMIYEIRTNLTFLYKNDISWNIHQVISCTTIVTQKR